MTRLGHMAGYLSADPGQLRHLPEWLPTVRGATTMSARVPWLPYRVLERLEAALASCEAGGRVFEFGGGGSTLWFADHGADVVTVEHDRDWVEHLATALVDEARCQLIHRDSSNDYAEYVATIAEWPDAHFDVVVVDGRERVRCLRESISKVRPGGLLILDDAERPRYRAAFDAVDWPHVTYRGLTPCKTVAGVTTVWSRPV